MKKWIFLCLASVCLLTACEENGTGDIYGIVTVKETAEPMRATGVELLQDGSLLLKTVTYDDGHYEFDDLHPGEYELQVMAAGYDDVSYSVMVEVGRTARADMQLERAETYMTVSTLEMTDWQTFLGDYYSEEEVAGHKTDTSADEVGFFLATSEDALLTGKRITASFIVHSVSCRSMWCRGKGQFSGQYALPNGTWYYQAYARNGYGTAYGEVRRVEVSGLPWVTTLPATNVTSRTATLNGVMDYDGEPPYAEKGFVYSASFPSPTVDDPVDATTKVAVKGISKEFSANISGLTDGITYYVRAYATNEAGTFYGEAVSFKAPSTVGYVELANYGLAVQNTDISAGIDWSYAGDICEASRVGGFSDWRLPTIGELSVLYTHRDEIGGFDENGRYWSSTERESGYSHYYYFYDFSEGKSSSIEYGSNNYRVRAVRTLQ